MYKALWGIHHFLSSLKKKNFLFKINTNKKLKFYIIMFWFKGQLNAFLSHGSHLLSQQQFTSHSSGFKSQLQSENFLFFNHFKKYMMI